MPAKKGQQPDDWMVRRPLQIEQLRLELPQSEEIEGQLRRLQHSRENVDAVVFALSNRELAEDRRTHLRELLGRHQDALDACLQQLGVPVRVRSPAPLWYFKRLDPMARQHLTSILGVTEERAYHEVLEIKSEEYLAQQAAFEVLANRLGFKESARLEQMAAQSALVLTLSGSLIQISAPLSPRGERRYLYQNIYGNTHPPAGVLLLDRDVRPGHRLRSVELTTSPVRLLCVVAQKVSWRAQSQNFERMARTLTSLVSRSAGQMAESGRPNPLTGMQRQINPEAAARVLREDNQPSFHRFRVLRQRFLGHDDEGDAEQVEAELLTLCHFLQMAARELGFDAKPLDTLHEFVTEGEQVYRVDPLDVGRVTLLSQPKVVFSGVSVGRQQVTRQAPLALVGGDGGLVEVTRPVIRFVPR